MSRRNNSNGFDSPRLIQKIMTNGSIKSEGHGSIKLSPSIDYETMHNLSLERSRDVNRNTTEKTFETILSEDEVEMKTDNERFTPIERPDKPQPQKSTYLDHMFELPSSALNTGGKPQLDNDLIQFYNDGKRAHSSSSSDGSIVLGKGINAPDYYNSLHMEGNAGQSVFSPMNAPPPPKYFSSDGETSEEEEVDMTKACIPFNSIYDAYYVLELHSDVREVDWIETTYNLKIQDEPQNKASCDQALLTLGIGLKSLPLVNMALNNSTVIKDYYMGVDFSFEDAMETLELKENSSEMDAIENFAKLCYNNENFNVKRVLDNGVYDNFVFYIICLQAVGEKLNSEVIRRYVKSGFVDKRLMKGDNWPVGLFNMGNTCYLNSLLQYYFAIAPIKNYILDYQPSDKQEGQLIDSIRCQDFVLQIQRLYRDMINNPYRVSIPPNELVYLVFAPRGGLGLVDGKIPDQESLDISLEVGRQQDVTECMLNYIDQLDNAVVLDKTSQAVHVSSASTVFNGSLTESFRDILDAKIQGKQNLEDFTSILINLHNKPKTLHDALEQFFSDDQEVMELEEYGQVKKQIFLKKLPDILQIQIQRVEFNKEILQPVKNAFQMEYPQTLYVDRYCEGVVSEEVNDQYKKYQIELEQCEKKRHVLMKKVRSNHSSTQALTLRGSVSSALKFLQAELAENAFEFEDTQLNESIKLLSAMKTHIDKQIEVLDTRIAYLKYKIENHYSNYTAHGYELFAAFMHRGEANYGHYWIYIKDGDMWRKYNDEDVDEVVSPEKSIFNFAKDNAETAYYLGYVRKDKINEMIKPLDRSVESV